MNISDLVTEHRKFVWKFLNSKSKREANNLALLNKNSENTFIKEFCKEVLSGKRNPIILEDIIKK